MTLVQLGSGTRSVFVFPGLRGRLGRRKNEDKILVCFLPRARYLQQPFEDNYVDDSFLDSLVLNANVTSYKLLTRCFVSIMGSCKRDARKVADALLQHSINSAAAVPSCHLCQCSTLGECREHGFSRFTRYTRVVRVQVWWKVQLNNDFRLLAAVGVMLFCCNVCAPTSLNMCLCKSWPVL